MMSDQQYSYMSYKTLMRVWQKHLAQDLAESQSLLLELGTSEPTLQQCFKIIESTCLSQGLFCSINGTKCTRQFQKHLDAYYIPFLKDALRAIIIFGFIPWRVRRIRSGDMIPEVLPPGTSDWHTEIGPTQHNRNMGSAGNRRRGPKDHDDDTRLVVYRVIPTAGSAGHQGRGCQHLHGDQPVAGGQCQFDHVIDSSVSSGAHSDRLQEPAQCPAVSVVC